MNRHIQGKDGKMQGSVGLGKDNIPTPQFIQQVPQEAPVVSSEALSIFDLWEEARRRQREEALLNREHDAEDFPSIPVFEVGKGDIILIDSSDESNGVPVKVLDTNPDTRDFIVRFRAQTAGGEVRDVEMKYPHTVPLLSRGPDNEPWPPPYWAPPRSEPQEAAEVFDEYDYEQRRLALRTQTNTLPEEPTSASNIQAEDVILVPSDPGSGYQWSAAEVTAMTKESPHTVVRVRDYFGNEQELALAPADLVAIARKGRGHSQEGWPAPGSERETRIQALQLRRGDVIELESSAPGGRQMVRIQSVAEHRDANGANKTTVRAIDRNGRTNGIVFDTNQPLDVIERGPEPEPKRPSQYEYLADTEPEPKFPTPFDFFVDIWSFMSNFGKNDRRR